MSESVGYGDVDKMGDDGRNGGTGMGGSGGDGCWNGGMGKMGNGDVDGDRRDEWICWRTGGVREEAEEGRDSRGAETPGWGKARGREQAGSWRMSSPEKSTQLCGRAGKTT